MSAITQKIHNWFESAPKPSSPRDVDTIGDQVRAAVAAQTRAKTDATRTYEARVQTMVDELFLRMKKADPDA